MTCHHHTVFVAKLLIETTSPLAINSGQRETNFDSALVRDVNGLPVIPATAIAGVWSHLVETYFDLATRQHWFGKADKAEAKASRFSISHGILHDAQNRPITPYLTEDKINNDAILSICQLARPYHRERVSINDRGVAKDTGKFDQIILPKGLCFSLHVRWTGKKEDDYQSIFALWNDRNMAFGASTRNGLGAIKLIQSEIKRFDLTQGAEQGAKLNQYVNQYSPLKRNEIANFTSNNPSQLLAVLPLKALDNWRCGSGSQLIDPSKATQKGSVGIITYSEPCWTWHQDVVKWQPKGKPVLCGSSIKGILAHRVAFHYRRHTSQWAEHMAEADHSTWETKPEGIHALFGFSCEKDHDNSRAGILLIEDCDLRFTHTVIRTHNSIDRFTGGVRKGALYSEELLYQPEFTLRIWLKPQAGAISPELKQALLDTFDDLKNGMLPMGAGSGRGTSVVMQTPNTLWTVNDASLVIQDENMPAEVNA